MATNCLPALVLKYPRWTTPDCPVRMYILYISAINTHHIHLHVPCPITLEISMEFFEKNMFFLLRSCWSCSSTSDIPVGTSELDWLAYIAGYLQRWVEVIHRITVIQCSWDIHGNILTKSSVHACAQHRGLSNQSVYFNSCRWPKNRFFVRYFSLFFHFIFPHSHLEM